MAFPWQRAVSAAPFPCRAFSIKTGLRPCKLHWYITALMCFWQNMPDICMTAHAAHVAYVCSSGNSSIDPSSIRFPSSAVQTLVLQTARCRQIKFAAWGEDIGPRLVQRRDYLLLPPSNRGTQEHADGPLASCLITDMRLCQSLCDLAQDRETITLLQRAL